MTSTFELALKIQSILKDFYLAGDTAIMFKYDHRTSMDLDFFCQRAFSYNKVAATLRKHFAINKEERMNDNIDFFVEGRRISFVFFPFKNIQSLQDFKGLKMASDYDIFLNKIYYAGRRVSPKDPFDAALLLKQYKWETKTIKNDFEQKFPNQSYEIYLGAMLNFGDYPDIEPWIKEILTTLLK